MAATFYRSPDGQSHQVTVVEVGKKMTLIQYFDNSRRGDRWKNGRRYNHGTLTRRWVYNHELKAVAV